MDRGRVQTAAFSTTGPRLLVAFAASDSPGGSTQTLAVSGAGLTWTLVRRVNAQRGVSEIWVANAPNSLTNVQVRAQQRFTLYRQSLTVVLFTGATAVGASAIASGASGGPTISLTTTAPNSRVYAVGNDSDRAVARTLEADQVMVQQWIDMTSTGTYWVQTRSTAIATPGTVVQLNATAPTNDRWNLAAVEVR